MRRNFVKRRLREGQASVGTWLSLGSATVARYLARVGFDWLTVDLEHTPTGLATAAEMFLAVAEAGCVPLARVPWNRPEHVKQVLDSGAWGIIVPMVNSRQEAEQAVAAAKHPLEGIRSIGGSLHALSFGTDPATYYQEANQEILVVVQIEHVKGVERAEEILSVPGIDAVFIGPNDLLASMGERPQMESSLPAFVEALEHVRTTARRCGVAPGIHVADAAAAARRMAEGFQFIAVASDLRFLVGGARATVEALPPDASRARAEGEMVRY